MLKQLICVALYVLCLLAPEKVNAQSLVAPSDFQAVIVESNFIKLQWNKVSNVDGYFIFESGNGGNIPVDSLPVNQVSGYIAKLSANDNSYVVSMLTPSTAYSYVVVAYAETQQIAFYSLQATLTVTTLDSLTVRISFDKSPAPIEDTVNITATLSRPVTPVKINIKMGQTTVLSSTDMAPAANSTIYTYSFIPAQSNGYGEATVHVQAGEDFQKKVIVEQSATFEITENPPVISSLSPSHNAVDVPITTDFTIEFDRSVRATDQGEITLYEEGVAKLVIPTNRSTYSMSFSFSFRASGGVLVKGKRYSIAISAGSFIDRKGNLSKRITGTEWSFTSFSEPIVSSITLNNANARQAFCIGDTVLLNGKFLTGITNVSFGASSAATVLEADGTRLEVIVPNDAQAGGVYLTKGGKKHPVSAGNGYAVGVSSAKVTLGTIDGKSGGTATSVCNTGSNTSAPVKFSILGTASPFSITYSIATNGNQPPQETTISYRGVSEGDIEITPIKNGANNISLVSVTDNNNCAVPRNKLTGVVTITQNQKPTVSAGGPGTAENKLSICLPDRNLYIQLDSSTLGSAPSASGTSSLKWTTSGNGLFSNDRTLTPSYGLTASDVRNLDEITFTLTSTFTPDGCEGSSDEVTLKLVSSPVANAGGNSADIQYACWDGKANNIAVRLNGLTTGGISAVQYQWSTIGAGTFSDQTLANPTYTFSKAEVLDRQAKVQLTVKGGCTDPDQLSQPDSLIIQLKTVPAISLKSPKTTVCTGEKVQYMVSDLNATSEYQWSLVNGRGTLSNAGNQHETGTVNVTYDASAQSDVLSVVEIDENGCESPLTKVPITIKDNQNWGFQIDGPNVFSFAKKKRLVLLKKGSGASTGDAFLRVSGSGIISKDNGTGGVDYYFTPSSFWEIQDEATKKASIAKTNISYYYEIKDASSATVCSSKTNTVEFTVYNGSQAFDVYKLNPDGSLQTQANGEPIKLALDLEKDRYEICANEAIKITLNKSFRVANPVQPGNRFKAFTADRPEFLQDRYGINNANNQQKPDAAFTNIEQDTAAVLYFNRLQEQLKEVTGDIVFEINGWETGPLTNGVISYGGISIFVNRVPNPSPTLISPTICSAEKSIELTRNSIANPGQKYEFAVNNNVYAGLITGSKGQNNFYLHPSVAFQNTGNAAYEIPKKIPIKYSYENEKGCKKDTVFQTITIIQTPKAPSIVNADDPTKPVSALCAGKHNIPTAEVTNWVSFDTIPKGGTAPQTVYPSITWYRNIIGDRNIPVNSGEKMLQFTPTTTNSNANDYLDVNRNGSIRFYATQTIKGCESDKTPFTYEVLNAPPFSWSKSCLAGNEKETIKFQINANNIDSLIWEINGNAVRKKGSVDNKNYFEYDFEKQGAYNVAVMLKKQNCTSSIYADTVVLLQTLKPETGKKFITRNFNKDDGGFFAQPAPKSKHNISTWEYGNPSDDSVIPKREGGLNMWATGLNNPYGDGERSYLYVGCIDLSEIEYPSVSFDAWIDLDEGNDGIVLQYSPDTLEIGNQNKVWRAVGKIGDQVNWYNKQLIQSIPNDDPAANYGWSSGKKENSDWKALKHVLDDIKERQEELQSSPLAFRFSFAAQPKVSIEEKKPSGFALDNFSINERDRIVLLENFTNKGSLANFLIEKNQSDFLASFVRNKVEKNLIMINYHVGFPAPDPLNLDAAEGSSSRSFFYGVKTPPTAFLGGYQPAEKQSSSSLPFSQWGKKEYNIQILNPGEAIINVEANTINDNSGEGDKVEINVTITSKNEDFSEKTKLYIAIVENEINSSQLPLKKRELLASTEGDFSYVFKKMIPSPIGEQIGPLESSSKKTVGPFYWYPDTKKIYSGSTADSMGPFLVIAILQNEETKHVYQVGFKEITLSNDKVTGIDEFGYEEHQVLVYPNPARQYITVNLPYSVKTDVPLQLISPEGAVVSDVQVIPKGKSTQKIDVRSLAEGVYVIKLTPKEDSPIYKKIMISPNK